MGISEYYNDNFYGTTYTTGGPYYYYAGDADIVYPEESLNSLLADKRKRKRIGKMYPKRMNNHRSISEPPFY